MSSTSRAALALALCLPLLHACVGNDDSDARVRLVNATTEYATMSFYQGTSQLTASVASNTVGGYSKLAAGDYTFNVRSSTSTVNLAPITQTVVKEDHYTEVAYFNAGALQTTMLTEDEDSPDSGYAKLRIFNAATTESSAVDVYVTTNACTALTSADAAIATDVTGLEDGFTEISASSSGTSWHVCVTGYQDQTDLRLDIPALTLKDQQVATLIVTESTGGYLMNGLVLDQQGDLAYYANPYARVRLVADAASAGTVTATANGTALGAAVTSPQIGGYALVTTGTLSLPDLAINGTQITQTGLATASGGDYTLLVAGSVASPTVTLLTDDNSPSIVTAKPVKVRFVNGLNGISGTASLTDTGSIVASSVAFGAASSYTNVVAASAAATLQATYTGSTLTPLTAQTFYSGGVYTIFLLGDTTAAQLDLSADN